MLSSIEVDICSSDLDSDSTIDIRLTIDTVVHLRINSPSPVAGDPGGLGGGEPPMVIFFRYTQKYCFPFFNTIFKKNIFFHFFTQTVRLWRVKPKDPARQPEVVWGVTMNNNIPSVLNRDHPPRKIYTCLFSRIHWKKIHENYTLIKSIKTIF